MRAAHLIAEQPIMCAAFVKKPILCVMITIFIIYGSLHLAPEIWFWSVKRELELLSDHDAFLVIAHEWIARNVSISSIIFCDDSICYFSLLRFLLSDERVL